MIRPGLLLLCMLVMSTVYTTVSEYIKFSLLPHPREDAVPVLVAYPVPVVLPSSVTTGSGEGNETTPTRQPCTQGKHPVKGRCVRVKRHKRRHHRQVHSNRGGKR